MDLHGMNELPSNSHKRRTEIEYEEEVSETPSETIIREKVITGSAQQKKRGLWGKFGLIFLGGDARSVGESIISEVVIPAFRDLMFAAGTQSFERAIYGDQSQPSTISPLRQHGVNRTTIRYDKPGVSHIQSVHNMRALGQTEYHTLDDIVLENRMDAQAVLDGLIGLVNTYEYASVADYKQFVDITPEHTDNKYGWSTNIYQTRLVRTVGGRYKLKLPMPLPID